MSHVVARNGIFTWWNLPLAQVVDGQTICGLVTDTGESVVDRTYDHPVVVDATAGVDDHNTASFIMPADAPPVAVSNQHGNSNSLRVLVGTEIGNIESLGSPTFLAGSNVSYNQIWRNGNDLWILARTSGNWGFWHSSDYGTSWDPVQSLMSATDGYISSIQIGSTVRCVAYTHPQTADHDVRYFEIDLTTGDVSNRDGSVIGNLDGTNLPLSITADLETVFSPAPGDNLRLYAVSNHTEPEIVVSTWTTDNDGVYRYIWWDGAAWQSESVVAEGGIIGFQSSSHYAGGAAFPADTDGGKLFISRNDGGTWKIERWAKTGGTWGVTELVDSSATQILARPWPSTGSDLVWISVTTYPGFTNWTGGHTWATAGTANVEPMALRFTESFDDGLYNLGKWATFTGTSALDTGRHGSSGLRVRSDANFDGRVSIPGTSEVLIGWAANYRTVSGVTEDILFLMESATIHVLVETIATTGDMRIRGGSGGLPVLATAAGAVTADGFHYFEMRAIIDDVNGLVELRKDGVTIASASGVDTRVGGAGVVNSVRFAGNTATTTTSLQTILDDIYIGDNVAGEVDALLGDVEVYALLPDADGDINQWTPNAGVVNFDRVDEVPPDDDTTYVETTVATDIDVYEMDDIATSGSVKAVTAYAYARNAGGGTINVAHAIRRGTTEIGSSLALASSYAIVSEIFELDPHTAAAWTRTNLNNTQFGLEAQ